MYTNSIRACIAEIILAITITAYNLVNLNRDYVSKRVFIRLVSLWEQSPENKHWEILFTKASDKNKIMQKMQ